VTKIKFPGHRAELNDDHVGAFAWLTRRLHWERSALRNASGKATVVVGSSGAGARPTRHHPPELVTEGSVIKGHASHRGGAFLTVLPEGSSPRNAG
jgi:hypothetical protein